MTRFASILLPLLALFSSSQAAKTVPKVDFDVIIVGGGPAGLSALSALCRVSRRAILYDTSEYRNGVTRNMHDVIGADGMAPDKFREAARAQINRYQLATFSNKRVERIEAGKSDDGFPIFTAYAEGGEQRTARRVVLATGVTDLIPNIKGATGPKGAYGKGMFWCPWCDGFEHRDQSMAVLGPLYDSLSSVLEVHNLNPDLVVLTNGQNTPEQREKLTKKDPDWEAKFKAWDVPILDNEVVEIERLRDGGEACTSPHPKPVHGQSDQQVLPNEVIPTDEDAGPNGKHYDLFRIHFKNGLMMERAAILINVPIKQTSNLHEGLKLKMGDENKVWVTNKTMTSVDGIFAIGDMNNEGATNVPHAMYNGKKAGIVIHVGLAKEEADAAISKRSLAVINEIRLERLSLEKIGNELELIWAKIKAQYASKQ